MNLAKLFAIAFCGAALLVQAYMVVTPLRRKNAIAAGDQCRVHAIEHPVIGLGHSRRHAEDEDAGCHAEGDAEYTDEQRAQVEKSCEDAHGFAFGTYAPILCKTRPPRTAVPSSALARRAGLESLSGRTRRD